MVRLEDDVVSPLDWKIEKSERKLLHFWSLYHISSQLETATAPYEKQRSNRQRLPLFGCKPVVSSWPSQVCFLKFEFRFGFDAPQFFALEQ